MQWKKLIGAVVLSVSIISSAALPGAQAEGQDTASASASVIQTHQLTQSITAEVKSVLNERLDGQTRIGAVMRIHNEGTQITRMPEGEIRLTTKGGVQYTLQPSMANAKSLQPKETAELSFMLMVDRSDAFILQTLSWVDVNEYVYPKQETIVFSDDVSAMVWHGNSDAVTEDLTDVKKWGESFTLPVLDSRLIYTPSTITKEVNGQGPVTVVTVNVHNPDPLSRTVPDFTLTGQSKLHLFAGTRVEQNSVMLQPGERKSIHFAIPGDNSEPFTGLIVTTPESYVQATADGKGRAIQYAVGRILLMLPSSNAQAISHLATYQFGQVIAFDPLNNLIDDHVKVALMELHMHGSDNDGYQTAVAKFKLTNESNLPMPIPNFQAQLSSPDGYTYSGVRQNMTTTSMMPNLSYVVSYSFNLPSSETGDSLALRILDNQTTAPYSAAIAAYHVAVQDQSDTSVYSFYPFDVKVDLWVLNASSNFVSGSATYSYKLKLDLDVDRKDNVVVDQNFSKIKFELADNLERVIGSKSVPFVGENRLVSGSQIIYFNNIRTDQIEDPLTLRIYESIDTPTGEVNRLVHTYSR